MSNTATSKDSTALKVKYRSPLDINEQQVAKAIEIMQSKPMPHDKKAEMAVLGAILGVNITDFESQKSNELVARVVKVRNLLRPKDFYIEQHQVIYEAICQLVDERKGMDMITVLHRLRVMGKLEEASGMDASQAGEAKKLGHNIDGHVASYLVECTNGIGSSLHAIDHANIVIDLSLRRSAILSNYLANSKLFDLSYDVYDLRNELADDLRVMPVNSFFTVRTANQRMEDGAMMPRVLQMCGSFWKKGEIVFLFAGPKRGKSIFAVQIADAISRGEGLFGDLLPNEAGPQRVGYVDFELYDNEFHERYSDDEHKRKYTFHDNLHFITINNDATGTGVNLDKLVIQSIEDAVLSFGLDAIVIDNITWLTRMNTSDTQAAVDLMRKLEELRRLTGISILILAHTPKINAVLPLSEDMMGGSKHLSNFAQGVFGIGKSAIGSDIRYIKECVRRNGTLHYDEENVIQVCIDKDLGTGNLIYRYMKVTHESVHLNDPNSADAKLEIVKAGADMRLRTPKSYQAIYDELDVERSIGWSIKQFTRKCKEEVDRRGTALIFNESEPEEDKLPFEENPRPTMSHVKPTAKAGEDIVEY